MSKRVQIVGLRGSVYRRGENSYRVQLSLGRNADGKYDVKRETIRGTEKDAVELLTRWNVEYLDNTIQATNHQTVQQAYEEWMRVVKVYRKPNTYRFYKERFETDILPEIGHYKLKDVTLSTLQEIMLKHPTKDQHNKRALSAFFGWCKRNKKVKENICPDLLTQAQPRKKTEDDIWTIEEVRKIYSHLTFKNLYDIFIVLGIELGLRPQEILALTWDDIHEGYIAIEEAVIERTPESFELGETKSKRERYLVLTPFVDEHLKLHKANQNKRIIKTKDYNRENNLVVADAKGHVPCRRYIRRYMMRKAQELGISVIPPKNLRTTHISLMKYFGIPTPDIQKQAGHAPGSDVTNKHYIVEYVESLRYASMTFHEKLHGKQDAKTEDLPKFAQ